MSPSKWLFPTKRAAADVPVRDPRAVATEPVEGASTGPAAHASAREDQLTAFGLIVVVREVCV